MGIVRSGRVAHIGSVLVTSPPVGVGAGMRRDEEAELRAIEVAINYEEQRGWTVDEVWKRHDGSGFDLRSVSPPDASGIRKVRRIEVKGRAPEMGAIRLSPNEWRKAARLRETYWLYVVWGAKSDSPRLKMIQDPWETFRASVQEIQDVKSYQVPANALTAAPGEEWRA